MHEIIVNLHMHTPYSDGHGGHKHIADAALSTGLDAVIVTDHNVLVGGPEGYYEDSDRKILMLVGEEIHDRARDPQKNHLLAFGTDRELASFAHDPQLLIDSVRDAGGLSFIAHPHDPESKVFHEPDLSWVSWDVYGFTGIELWNSLTEFKSKLSTKFHAAYLAFNPKQVATGPFPQTIRLWDNLLAKGKKVVAIGGSDAHALPGRMGPFTRTIFPYEFHFQCINTHLILPEPMDGNLEHDKSLILNALRSGHAFIGYDLPAPTRGFRFNAHGRDATVHMGDEVRLYEGQGVTFQIHLPQKADCILMKDGQPIKKWGNRESITHAATEPGVFRVEVYINYLRQRRGWIFSNPIYVSR